MRIQAFVAEPAIEGLGEGVVRRLALPREVQRYAVLILSAIQGLRDKLRATVNAQGVRGDTYRCDPVHGLDDLL